MACIFINTNRGGSRVEETEVWWQLSGSSQTRVIQRRHPGTFPRISSHPNTSERKKTSECGHMSNPSQTPPFPPCDECCARARFRRRRRRRRAAQTGPNRLPNTGSLAFGSIPGPLKGAAAFSGGRKKNSTAPCSGASPRCRARVPAVTPPARCSASQPPL